VIPRAVARWLTALAMLAALLAAAPSPARTAAVAPAGIESREILVMLRLSPDHFRPGAAYGGDYGDGLTSSARRRAARAIAHRNGLDLMEDGWPMPLMGLDCYVMRVPPELSIDAAIAQVSRDPQVVWSQPMQVYRTRGSPPRADDPLLAAQPAATLWHLADLHRMATGRGVTIAVIDSKIDVNHPDLAGQFVANQDFVASRAVAPERHGTGIAGVIAAKAGNGIGIEGIAPDARLMALRACWEEDDRSASGQTLCNSLSLAQAIQFAVLHKAGVINLSLSGPADRLLEQLLRIAIARHIVVVAAFDSGLPGGGFPASLPGVIAVATESVASLPAGIYSAPGQDILTTQPGGRWFLVDGSSYAAAHVSGLIALVREMRATDPRVSLVSAGHAGGQIDACATVLRVARPCSCSCGPLVQATAFRM
jgi:hypothetical protein